MIIVPRISNKLTVVPDKIIEHINDSVEIKMFGIGNVQETFDSEFEDCVNVIKYIKVRKQLNDICISFPDRNRLNDLSIYCINRGYMNKLIELAARFVILASQLDTNIHLLFESTEDLGVLLNSDEVIKRLEGLIDCLDNSNVDILIKNSLPNLNRFDNKELGSIELVNYFKDKEKINICLDISNAKAYENIFKHHSKYEFAIPQSLIEKVKWVHFSYVKNNDGYDNCNTRGLCHPNMESAKKDDTFLRSILGTGFKYRELHITADVQDTDSLMEELKYLEGMNL